MQNRVFSVDINGVSVAGQMNIAEEYGSERAVIKKYIVPVSQGKGACRSFWSGRVCAYFKCNTNRKRILEDEK